MNRKLDNVYKLAKRIKIDDKTKIVIMSDCHRGAGDSYDNFLKNEGIYDGALIYYYNNGYTYVELGDGDDMWEVRDYEDITQVHLDTFKQLKKFYDDNRLIMVYGNHDIVKRVPLILEKYFYRYYDWELKREEALLEGLVVYEGLVLDYYGKEIFLVHGHQVDFLNSTLWRLSRFLVRYGWRGLEYLGIKDPTSTAKNYLVGRNIERKLERWSQQRNKIVIAGHTHRPIFPNNSESLYFNDGSCIHPNGITCIEIEGGNITLVKWGFRAVEDKKNLLAVKRRVLKGSEPIRQFFKNDRDI